jgi:hypothetical protein
MLKDRKKMDYLLFYSQYSPSSKKILEQFPNIINKAVSVDSSQMKKHLKKLSIVCVPTLIIFSEGKILERIAGYAKIYNWILVTLYRIDQIQPQDEPQQPQVQQYQPQPQQSQPQMSQAQMSQSQIPQPQISQTQTVTQLPQQVQQVEEDVIIEDDLMIQGKTSLDDLVLEDIPEREEPTRPSSNSGSTMQLAEALKKERDNLDPKSKKKFVTDRGGS